MYVTCKEVIRPEMRVIVALRIIAYGIGFDKGDKLCGMTESSVRLSFKS